MTKKLLGGGGNSKTFLQFPLCLLQADFNPMDGETFDLSFRLQYIFAYWLCEEARRVREKDNFQAIVNEYGTGKYLMPDDYEAFSNLHIAMHYAAKEAGFFLSSFKTTIARGKESNKYLMSWEERSGRDVSVRIGREIFANYFGEIEPEASEKRHREFSAICALNSIIGDSAYKSASMDRVLAAWHGYKSAKYFGVGNAVITKRQLGRTIDKLVTQENPIFSRFTVKRQRIYYSWKLTQLELVNAVSKKRGLNDKLIEEKMIVEQAVRECEYYIPETVN